MAAVGRAKGILEGVDKEAEVVGASEKARSALSYGGTPLSMAVTALASGP